MEKIAGAFHPPGASVEEIYQLRYRKLACLILSSPLEEKDMTNIGDPGTAVALQGSSKTKMLNVQNFVYIQRGCVMPKK